MQISKNIEVLKILIFALIIFGFKNSFSQTSDITGSIIEKESKEPLQGATILLYNSSGAVFKGTTTNSLGVFKFNSIPNENYNLEISFIGFKTDTIKNLQLKKNINIGVVKLKPSDLLLDKVIISGEKAIYTTHLDKKVYNVQKDVFAETSSASEILQNVPSVNVDINGGITLRNTSNITFFINGKPSALLRKNPSAILEQMPASSIERIEVITNPSAKYRPDGVGGIINIVLKKDAAQGLSGQIGANVGNEGRYNANINLNYGAENFKLFGNYGIRHSNASILYTDERTYKDSLENIHSFYYEAGNSKTNSLSHNAFIGANYDINDYNNFEVSGNYFIGLPIYISNTWCSSS